MASSSSISSIKIDTNESYVLKDRTMTIPLNKLDVQVEATVDFGSLERNEVFDRRDAKDEEVRAVKENLILKGKSREEMSLRPFNGTEIRSTVTDMEITITVETIAKACRCPNEGQYQWEKKITEVLFNGNPKAKSSDLSPTHRVLKKIVSECIFQKGGGTDAPSLDHKLVLCFLATYERINLPKYILHHMCWALRESQRIGRRQIPFGRLLSEIFVQGKLLKYLKESGVSSDEELGTVVGKIISGKTLSSMQLIKDLILSEEDLKTENVQSYLMTDFPSISREDNPEVLYQYIKAHFQHTGEIISIASIPEKIGGAPLKVKGKRSKNAGKDDDSEPKPKIAKTAKAEGSTISASDEVIQKKRNKKPEVRDVAREAALREKVIQKT
ncbi:hypothetical protein MTR_6g049080 [Medicago truncatula]|uniref:Uncharacterized protein n=1 Tax=Medicago truncatula TaxID=3880 RepID=A0A072U9D6_MEDTR|nr:hypothetical protein MTR_6g049080 [Medicago truncatula]